MQWQLILGFAKSFQSLATFPKVSIGSAKAMVKDEETIQPVLGENAYENTNWDLSPLVDIK
jgi:hypothetical protein